MSNEEEEVSIYLSPKSKTLLSERLAALGYGNYTGDRVIVHGHPKERDIGGFRTIYGQKTAFRVKHIIEANGMLVVSCLLVFFVCVKLHQGCGSSLVSFR